MFKKKSAFTLLELIVSIALLVAIFGAVYQVLLSTVTVGSKIEEAIDEGTIVPSIMTVIISDLHCLLVPNNDLTFFLGKDDGSDEDAKDELHFLTTVSKIDLTEKKISDINEVAYFLRPNQKTSGMFYLCRRLDDFKDEDISTGGKITIIYEYALGLDIEYYDGKEWFKEWDNKEKKSKPQVIKIKFTYYLSTDQNDTQKKPLSVTEYIYIPKLD